MTSFYYGLSTLLRAASASGPLFLSLSGQSLSGRPISRKDLLGQPTLVVLTPSRKDRKLSGRWFKILSETFSSNVRIRDIVLIDPPFFMSEQEFVARARKAVPRKHWDETWLVPDVRQGENNDLSEQSEKTYVYVLDSEGDVIARVGGEPSEEKIEKIKHTLLSITPLAPVPMPDPREPR